MSRRHDVGVHDYRQLEVWKKARALTLAIYKATSSFPESERFRLTSQMRRAAVSIVANIAEGAGRGSNVDFRRFIRYAIGSSTELECHLDLGSALGYIPRPLKDALDEDLGHVRAMLLSFARSLGRA